MLSVKRLAAGYICPALSLLSFMPRSGNTSPAFTHIHSFAHSSSPRTQHTLLCCIMAGSSKKSSGGGLFGFGKTVAPEPAPQRRSSAQQQVKISGSAPQKLAAEPAKAAPAPAPAQAPRPAAPSAHHHSSSSNIPSAAAQTSSMRREDASTAFRARPRVPCRLTDTFANFMVLGESGLGKTTFLKNLTSSFKILNANQAKDGTSTTLSQFHNDPDSLKTCLEPMEIPESSRRLMISFQDTPGWGDDINLMRYLRTITAYLLEQQAKDYDKVAAGRILGKEAMCGQLQHTVTACLYFIPPHRMKKVDLILMAAISQLVTIIPVIAKADCMTPAELKEYRGEVLAALRNPNSLVATKNLPQLDMSLFNFTETLMAELRMDRSHLPLAVVASRVSEVCTPQALASLGLSDVHNPTQPVRQYKWGACFPLNREHSDVILLKRLLLGDRVESLYTMLDDAYNRCESFANSYDECGKQLQLLVEDACNVGGPHLEYDDYTKAKVALDSAKAAMTTLSEENKSLTQRVAGLERERQRLLERLAANKVDA